MSTLIYRERPAAGEPQGLLVLHHGRGTDENDLLPLAEVLDPKRRLHIVTPRAPLQPQGTIGYHWYRVSRVGYPDPETFMEAYSKLAELHDELWQRTGIGPERTVLGGFSMGTAMSYALGLAEGRPQPGGILAFSGFVPTVDGWEPDLRDRGGMPVFIAHGRRDEVIDVAFAHRARELLQDAGMRVDYHESEGGHHIDPRQIPAASVWLEKALAL